MIFAEEVELDFFDNEDGVLDPQGDVFGGIFGDVLFLQCVLQFLHLRLRGIVALAEQFIQDCGTIAADFIQRISDALFVSLRASVEDLTVRVGEAFEIKFTERKPNLLARIGVFSPNSLDSEVFNPFFQNCGSHQAWFEEHVDLGFVLSGDVAQSVVSCVDDEFFQSPKDSHKLVRIGFIGAAE